MTLRARVRRLVRARSDGAPQAFSPGTFYSPVVPATEVLAAPEVDRIWPAVPADPLGIEVREAEQLALLKELGAHRFDPAAARPDPAYDPANDQFPPHDAAVLYAMIRHLRPARMIEVGCGWSTTVAVSAIREGALDTELTCIEPYPRDFLRRLPAGVVLRQERVEHTPLGLFDALASGDVLFVDSSHVAKTGSDVVHLVLQVLPRLADGVVVHVHDIFMPDDYPQPWVRAGFNWNEQYLVQAYLSGNTHARVLLLNHWLARRHPTAVTEVLGPLELNGSSIWFVTGPQ